jgi:ankyrin repeat protein
MFQQRLDRALQVAGANLDAMVLFNEDRPDVSGRGTPLQLAVMLAETEQDVKQIKLLLTRGSNPNARNWRQETPLYLASFRVSSDVTLSIVQLLLQFGADPLLTMRGGRLTALSMVYDDQDPRVYHELIRAIVPVDVLAVPIRLLIVEYADVVFKVL